MVDPTTGPPKIVGSDTPAESAGIVVLGVPVGEAAFVNNYVRSKGGSQDWDDVAVVAGVRADVQSLSMLGVIDA